LSGSTRAYDLIVFDWDGTLIDSVHRITTCFRMTFEAEGQPWPGTRAVRDTIGLPLVESFPILSHASDPELIARLVGTYREIWLSNRIPRSALFPDVPALLSRLEEAGYVLAVATGKSRPGMEREAGTHGIIDRFRVTRCAGETAPKPHPEMLRQILDEVGTRPERALMVGDHTLDLEMAHAAGMAAVGVTTGSVDSERLEAAGPKACLDAVGDLIDLLQA